MALIVMRLAEMHRVHPRQDDSRVCSKCGERVGIFPSGQAVLQRDPTTQIFCHICYVNGEAPADIETMAPGAEGELSESVPARRNGARH
jgi:hypothetical protein